MIAGVDQGGDGEAAAGGLSREGDVRRGDAVVHEGFIGRKSVVNRCRIRVLGSEPVVDADDLGVRPPTDLRGQASGEEGVRHHLHAAVEVQNNVARFDSSTVKGIAETGSWMDTRQVRSILVTSSNGTFLGVVRRQDLDVAEPAGASAEA